jgi:hypothetical protein
MKIAKIIVPFLLISTISSSAFAAGWRTVDQTSRCKMYLPGMNAYANIPCWAYDAMS